MRLFVFLVLFGFGHQALADSYPKLFGTFELPSRNIARFPKWAEMLARYEDGNEHCDDIGCTKKGWAQLLDRLSHDDSDTQLREINRVINRHPYILDFVNWGIEDYWETPFQFLKKSGDCEDYAIAKFMALKALGWRQNDMRVVAVRDLNRHLGHAILVIYRNGRAYVLDNQVGAILPAESIHHYQPVYSINENGWWLHGS